MLPYADNIEDYWTGYFTSRAQAKKLDRQTSSYLHASNKLFAESMLKDKVSDDAVKSALDNKEKLFDAMGIMQHHDAITGTAK